MMITRTVVTANTRGPSVNIVTWVTLIAVCLATLTKLGLKYSNIRGFEGDDVYMIGAMVRGPLILLRWNSPSSKLKDRWLTLFEE